MLEDQRVTGALGTIYVGRKEPSRNLNDVCERCVVQFEGDIISPGKCSQASPKQRVVHDSKVCKLRFTLDLNRTLKVDRDLFAVGCSLIFLGCALLDYFGSNDWFYFVELLRLGWASLPSPIITM